MPATAGRVRMPANNRVHSSAALQTHGIWQSAIGYDPYAPNKEEKKDKSAQKSSIPEPEGENAYASFQGLLALARITGSNADEVRGACKKCGRVGHLTFQCRNFLSAKDEGDREGKDSDAIQGTVLTGLEKLNGERAKGREKPAVESSDKDEEESETSDSGYDSEIERAIAGKYGKRFGGWRSKVSKSSKKKDENESDEDRGGRKRGRSTKRSVKSGRSDSADEEEVRRKKRKEKRRRNDDDSLDEEEEERRRRRRKRRKSRKEEGRRRSHRHPDDDISDDSPEQRLKKRRRRGYSDSDSGDNGLDNSRVGRGKKRSGKKSRNHHREDE